MYGEKKTREFPQVRLKSLNCPLCEGYNLGRIGSLDCILHTSDNCVLVNLTCGISLHFFTIQVCKDPIHVEDFSI